MSLISCSECGKEVSDKAAACPNCGAPIKQAPNPAESSKAPTQVKREGAKWEGMGTVLIILGIIVALFGNFQPGGILFALGFVVFIVGRFK
jgi:uncharacterized membrane protein YvbJ